MIVFRYLTPELMREALKILRRLIKGWPLLRMLWREQNNLSTTLKRTN